MGGRLTDAATLVATDEQLSSTLDDEEVVLHTGTGTYFGLNEVGARVWAQLAEPTTVAEVVEAVNETYDVSAERCDRDVRAFLERLLEADLVEVVDGDRE